MAWKNLRAEIEEEFGLYEEETSYQIDAELSRKSEEFKARNRERARAWLAGLTPEHRRARNRAHKARQADRDRRSPESYQKRLDSAKVRAKRFRAALRVGDANRGKPFRPGPELLARIVDRRNSLADLVRETGRSWHTLYRIRRNGGGPPVKGQKKNEP